MAPNGDPNKPKVKRTVKKRPLVVAYTGEGVEIKAITRDLGSVIDLMTANPGVKIHKVEV